MGDICKKMSFDPVGFGELKVFDLEFLSPGFYFSLKFYFFSFKPVKTQPYIS